jgi:biotin carboxylase
MLLYLLALNPTDSVTEGFLPAAGRLGLDVVVLTDQPEAHRDKYSTDKYGVNGNIEILACDVRDFRAVISRISAHRPPDAVFSNSDHLQTQTALAAQYFGLPAKSWQAALRAKDKAEMRRRLAAVGADSVWSVELPAGPDPGAALAGLDVPYPCVVKPREGVASEDVVQVDGLDALVRHSREIRERRPHDALVVEEFLPGQLYTLETLGDGTVRHVLGGFHTELSPPPYFIEERLTFVAAHPASIVAQVLAQLDALGVGFGACHTEFVVHEGRARLIEVNYRAIGDQCDLLLAELLAIALFEHILSVHLGDGLPRDLAARTHWAARLDYPYAQLAGTLTAAPDPTDLELEADQVHLTYRPLRAVGERHPLHHTNRDLLGVVRAMGPDQDVVDRAVTGFLAAHRWEITP